MTQTQRLYNFLVSHPGATIAEITYGLDPFVSNPRARISDLRKRGEIEGFTVLPVKRADGVVGYHLRPTGELTLGLAS